jgi:hypothetical protein
MAVAMFMRYPGVTPEEYDHLMLNLNLDAEPPVGEIIHAAAESPDGIRVADIWRTSAAAEAFVANRLKPALAESGIVAELEYEILPLHNAYAPEIEALEHMAAVSLPEVDSSAVL